MILKIIDERRAKLLATPDNPEVLTLSKQIEGRRRWHDDHLMLEPTGHNLDLLRGRIPSLLIQPKMAQYTSQTKRNIKYIERYPSYPYQQSALEKALDARKNSKGFALWCDPGTGKSKIAIDFMGNLFCEGEIDAVIVLAPKGVHRQWAEDQIPTHSGLSYTSHWWNVGRAKPWVTKHGDAKSPAIPWYCINYDALRTINGRAIFKIAQRYKRFGLVLDESHFVKNYRAKRWKATMELASLKGCTSRILLSGTPITKQLEDEWAQLRIADEKIIGIRYVTHFRNQFCIYGGYENKEFLGPKNLEKYRAKTGPFIFRATKDELEGLPEKVYKRWWFSMGSEQERIYHKMRRDLIVQIKSGEIADAANAAVAVIRLQQISNGFLQPENEDAVNMMPLENNPRIQAISQILKEDVGDDHQAIVWCRFQQDVRNLVAMFDDATPLFGPMADEERENSINYWLHGDKRLLVATPGTGGTGLNLQIGGCKHAIYYSNSEHFTLRKQSEDRIHRIGSAGNQTIYYDIIAENSRDMHILANLKAKKSLSDLVLDDIVHELETI